MEKINGIEMYNVGELIEILSGFPKHYKVFVDGYEGGYDAAKKPHEITVYQDREEGYASCMGRFEESYSPWTGTCQNDTENENIEGILIGR